MKKVILKAPAKVNLFLNIIGKREDGYHLLESVMQTIDLFDTVTLELREDKEICISCDNKLVPCNEKNIAYRIARKIFDYKDISKGLNIDIKKRIPIESGMGGGSADGAATLVGINNLFSLRLSHEETIRIGKEVGADIPFITFGGTAFAEGIGEKITQINDISECYFLVVKPKESINTKEAFREIDERNITIDKDIKYILSAVEERKNIKIAENMGNVFEEIAGEGILNLKKEIKVSGAVNSIMTGSGSAVFGLFEDEKAVEKAAKKFKNIYEEVFVCRPYNKGATIYDSF